MSRLKTTKFKKACAFPIMALMAASVATAAQVNWNGSVDNDWFNADNWDGGVLPGTADEALFPNNGSAVIDSQTAAIGRLADLSHGYTLTIQGSSAENKGILSITSLGDQFATGGSEITNIIIKNNGVFSMTAGTNQKAYFGWAGGSEAYLRIEEGGLYEMSTSVGSDYKLGRLQIGASGKATMDVGGGNVSVGNINVGNSGGATGIVNISGGRIYASYMIQVGNLGGAAGGEGGNGTVNITGGTVETRYFEIGAHGLSAGQTGDSGNSVGTGVVNLYDGGTLKATGSTNIAYGGRGTLNVYGGTATLGTLYIGNRQEHATIKAEGDLNVSGGTVNSGTAYVGYYTAGTMGTMNISGGSYTSSGTVYAGYNGAGEIYISGTGTFAANTVYLGYNASGSGLLEIQRQIGSLYRANGTTLTTIMGRNGTGTVRFNYSGAMEFANVMSGAPLKVEHVNTGVTTLTGTNTYGGGTLLTKGTIVAANISALGTGLLEIKGGTLKTSVNGLTVSAIAQTSGKMAFQDGAINQVNVNNLTIQGGSLEIDIESLSSFDSFLSASGAVILENAILDLNGYVGFEGVIGGEGYKYQIFQGYDPIAGHSLTITGYNKYEWFADIDSEGYLFFVAIPEAGTYAVVFGALALAFAAYRKRR